jgi:Zn-dependent protease with chaperone function
MPFCTQCGFQNDHDASYCNGCGHELIDSEVSPPTRKNRDKSKWPVLVVGLVLLLVAGGTTLHLANVRLWPGADSGRSKGSISVPDDPPVEKPRDIQRDISEIQKTASRTADKVLGSDQELGPMDNPPIPLKEGLQDVEAARNYRYYQQNCNNLFSDVGQQVASSMETELARATAISAAEENRLGRRYHEAYKREYKGRMDTYGGWVEYVRALGASLSARTTRKGIDYHFHVIQKADENAFALPGGGIYICMGLLRKIENEAQLANVLAHEIKHVDLRHCIAMDQVLSRLPGPAQSAAELIAQFARHPYSARREAEADRRGLELTYSFGYSPYQTVRYWEEKTSETSDSSEPKRDRRPFGNVVSRVTDEIENVLSTHPKSCKRSCLLKNHIIKLQKAYPMGWVYVGKWNFEKRISMFQQEM